MNNEEAKRQEIEKAIEEFNRDAGILTEHADIIAGMLFGLSGTVNRNVTEEFRKFYDEISVITNNAMKLATEIDGFKKQFGEANFSMTPSQINDKLNEFKARMKSLKITHVDKYNSCIDANNRRIDELKTMTGLDPDIAQMINELEKMSRCDVTIRDWRQYSYFDEINYNKLYEINRKIRQIEDRLNLTRNQDQVDLENDIKHIEEEIPRLENEKDENKLLNGIRIVFENIKEFKVKLENNKDKITPELYKSYLERIKVAEGNIEKIANLNQNKTNGNDYKEIKEKLNSLNDEVNQVNDLITVFSGKVTSSALAVFEDMLNKIEKKLEDIIKDIEEKHKDGKLDDVQYRNLIDKVNELKDKINKSKDILKDPKMANDLDVFAFLNGQIDGLEKAITALKAQVDKLEKPVKDKNVRKQIEDAIKKIEDEVKLINANLEKYKEEDPEKYNDAKNRLNNIEKQLANINKDYRKKCPLLVKAKKSAKEFYKKHKKLVLIAAGLATIAIIHATVGPIIIPAIMHGNLMIKEFAPALTYIMDGINNVLGSLIHATLDANGMWHLANGVIINPLIASSSLLKGLAISGIGSAALIAPIVVAIKELIEKMKSAELKQKIEEKLKEGKEKTKEEIEKLKKKKEELLAKTKKKKQPKQSEKTEGSKTEPVSPEKSEDSKAKPQKVDPPIKEEIIDKNKLIELAKEYAISEYENTYEEFNKFCEDNKLTEKEKFELEEIVKKYGFLQEKKAKGGR